MNQVQDSLFPTEDPIKPARPGKKLEKDFAEFMKTDLGYSKIELNQPAKGKIAERGYEVDIHGVRDNPKMHKLKRLGVLYALFCFGLWYVNHTVGSLVVVLGVFGVAAALYAFNKETTHTWVECKDHKTNVKRAQVQKLIMSVEDVRNLEDPKWTPNSIMMVSGTDFDADALHFAKEHKIECFRRTAAGFVRV